MAQTEKQLEIPTDDKKKDAKGGRVADYLQAPRKKRKSYVLMALSSSVQAELASGVEAYVRTTFKNVAVAMPKTPEELFKNFSRQIVLLVFDDEFTDIGRGLELLGEMKRKKSTSVVPILFLTRDPQKLIEEYNKRLGAYHESDDYINHTRAEMSHIYSKIRFGLMNKNARRSRRYKIDQLLNYYLLTDDKMHPGRLSDLSVHGALLKAEDGRLFRPGEQLKLHLPVTEYLPPSAGDYLKLSARVRRVFIAGNQAGISFEHLSEGQLLMLTRYLTEVVNDQSAKRNLAMKAKAART